MTDPANTRRFLRNWHDEMNGAALYDVLADVDRDPNRQDIFRQLAESERGHARVWQQRLQRAGVTVPAFKPDFRTRLLRRLVRWFGPGFVMSTVAAAEYADRNKYAGQPDAALLSTEERGHAAIVQAVAGRGGRHGADGSTIANAEPWHHGASSGNDLRAAVLGANDGLVSNFCLVMGIAGAGVAAKVILLTGIAGLLAGACSMALGEWLSVTNARELATSQLAKEAEELEQTPLAEQHELALIYRAKGMAKEDAEHLAAQMMQNPETALDALAREELGIDPNELGGNPWRVATTSFLLFAFGAAVPVLPFVFATGTTAMVVSLLLSALALVGIGAVTSLFNGRPVWYSAGRQMLTGTAAAALTFGLGHLFGASLS
ncbi:VIT1/CCC1 transporter family protein [Andreprevotia chitinilytica]|uniref:VIT1/CCC1 transporter family protein n=1 Tax=Andreprevotia chitinilytica TaxID=396808 RepID=UPI00054D1438|nr:VIT1/CCC1 transporter family protein [Andreprevotia chitinilytica]